MTGGSTGRLPWIKYTPSEWAGRYSELDDAEFGLLHRAVVHLWAAPDRRMPLAQLRAALRIREGDPRADLLAGLIGYALVLGADGSLSCSVVDEAATEAIRRATAGAVGAAGRWGSGRPGATPSKPATVDF